MTQVGSDAWFGEIETWLHQLIMHLPQDAGEERAELLALIAEIEGVRVISGRVRVVRRAPDVI
jgi:hypothetical protein